MNEDEAWDRFASVRDEQFKKASALGTIDVLQAQLNRLTADTEEIKQKINEMSAEQSESSAAPAPAPEEVPSAEGDMGAGMGTEEGDQTMDQTEMGPEMGQTAQPPAPEDQAMGGGIPDMSDEDLDKLFGGSEENAEEGSSETPDETMDPTLAALQNAVAEAKDPEVIANLAKMIVDYMGKGESEGEKEVLPGVPDETPIEEVPAGELDDIMKSETAVADTTPAVKPAPKVVESDNVKASEEQSSNNGVPDSGTAVSGDNASKGGFTESCTEDVKKSEDEEKKEDEESEDDKKEDEEKKEDDKPESEDEDKDTVEEIPEAEPEAVVTEVEIEEPEMSGEEEQVAISDLLDMSFGDIIDMVKDVAEKPEDDANVFINDEGKESIPFANCNGKPAPIKRSIDDLIMEHNGNMVGADGKKYQFSKSVKNRKSIDRLNNDMHSYDKVKGMKAGEVLSACKFMKSLGMQDVEANNMDALDVIVRGLDRKIGTERTNAFMKSAGMDLDSIYKTNEIKKSAPVEGGKHIKTLAETGGMDIKKSGEAPDVPRAADAGKAYVTPGDMKQGLRSIDDIIAGRMKG